MTKIEKLSDLQPTIAFSEYDFFNLYVNSYPSSEIGGIDQAIPWVELIASLRLKEHDGKGRKTYFSPKGKLALMFLKSYTGMSDSMLIESLNSNIHYQIFCDVRIQPEYPLSNYKIVSQIRCELAAVLDIDGIQQVLAGHWKSYMEGLSVCMSDATCYESQLRFPTNEKLLWESIEWVHQRIISLCGERQIRRPRNKYDEIQRRYMHFSRTRKKTQKKKAKLRRALLYLLGKLSGQLDDIERQHAQHLQLGSHYHKRRNSIRRVLIQQKQMHATGKSMPERIVSLDKPYIRPIVRGKEVKAVEFGAKANLIQVDGINFIEHIAFTAFNEGTRGISSIQYAQLLFRKRITHFAGDAIYATNKTRKYCSSRPRPIYTSFIPKGKKAHDEKERQYLRSILSKERATRLEGSFGTEKEHYNLRRIKARTSKTEILWIFFGIHTANAVRIIEKMKRGVPQNST